MTRSLVTLVALLALAALTLTLAACGQDVPPGPVRLVELAQGTEVSWPDTGGAKPPEAVVLSRLGALPKPGRVAEVPMAEGEDGYDSRAALLAPRGTSYRFHLRPAKGAVLRLGLGYALVEGGAGRKIDFTVSVAREGGTAETLLAETVTTRDLGDWQDHRLSLAPWAGRDVVLELATAPAPPGEDVVWAAFSAPEVTPGKIAEPGPDVVFISLDTLRADHLSCYGHERETSPHLDRLAATGYRFAQAVSQAPWTRPSHRAMMTGQFPLSHGEATDPLALTLWRAGYRTGAVTGGGQVSFQFGFHAGFETYQVSRWVRDLDGVTRWLDEAPGRKSFLFLHTFEIHDPYDHDDFTDGLEPGRIRPGFSNKEWSAWRKEGLSEAEKTYVEALYDGGIRFTDDVLGRLFAELDRRGILERAIVVVTSDHGEQFFEHGSWRHGSTMYDHQLMVPLIVHLPEAMTASFGGPRVVEEQVRLVDLYPTLLELLGLEVPAGVQGRSLRPLLHGEEEDGERIAFAENTNIPRERKALRTSRMKFVYSFHKNPKAGDWERLELYDLSRDPQEQHNLADERPEVVAELKAQVARITGEFRGVDFDAEVPETIDPKLKKELEALGYFGN